MVVKGKARWLAAGPACASVPEVICSAEPRQTVAAVAAAASEREQEGEQGRPIAREGDRAKGKGKKGEEGQR